VTGLLSTAAVAGGSFFSLIGYQRYGVRGGTRSCQLKWEQRESEIRDVIAQQEPTHHAEQ
jgi:hypothetical protein